MFKFQCYYCLKLFKIEPSDLGGEVQCPHCVEVVALPRMRLERGNVLGDFVIQHKIATWERGKIYAALQLSLDRMIALKVLFPEYAGDPAAVNEFIQEARDEAKLDYPHVGQVFALGEDKGIFYSGLENVNTVDTNTTILMREIVIQGDDFEETVEEEETPPLRKAAPVNVKVAEPVEMPAASNDASVAEDPQARKVQTRGRKLVKPSSGNSGSERDMVNNLKKTQGLKTKIRMPGSMKKGGAKTKLKIGKSSKKK